MSHNFWPVLVLNVSSATTKYLQIRSTYRGSISEMQCISWKTIKVIGAAELLVIPFFAIWMHGGPQPIGGAIAAEFKVLYYTLCLYL